MFKKLIEKYKNRPDKYKIIYHKAIKTEIVPNNPFQEMITYRVEHTFYAKGLYKAKRLKRILLSNKKGCLTDNIKYDYVEILPIQGETNV